MTDFQTGMLCFCVFLSGCLFTIMRYELKKIFAEQKKTIHKFDKKYQIIEEKINNAYAKTRDGRKRVYTKNSDAPDYPKPHPLSAPPQHHRHRHK